MAKREITDAREPLFADASELVVLHKVMAAREVLAALGTLTEEQFRRCLAFELGIAEYYFENLLTFDRGSSEPADPTFRRFLRYHANREYGDNAVAVYETWVSMVEDEALLEVRQLGAESTRKGTSSDGMHRPLERAKNYFRRAMGV